MLKGMISTLKKLEKQWDNKYKLFSASGTLVLIDVKSGKVIEIFPGISNDGGDPYFYTDHYGQDYLYEDITMCMLSENFDPDTD